MTKIKTSVFARNFRGFQHIDLDLSMVTFLVGDNSSGKSSILHLANSVTRHALSLPPALDEELGVSEYDYFSPYFDFSDVTFGLKEENDDGDFIAKVVTFRRTPGKRPVPTRCSYVGRKHAITLRRSAGNLVVRIHHGDNSDTMKILEAHDANRGFRRARGTDYATGIADAVALFVALEPSIERGNKDIQTLIGKALALEASPVTVVGPTRSLPIKFYDFSRRISSMGLHFATMWHDFVGGKHRRETAAIDAFGREARLFDSIRVKKIAKSIPDSPLVVSIKKNDREFLLNQVGVGVSQVVPVLAEAVFSTISERRRASLIQQPELHLHPIAQAALGSFFFKMSKNGFRAVLETHSSFMIDRFRAELRDSTTRKVPCQIIFCENTGSGNVTHTIRIGDDGKLIGAPDQYFDFFINELSRTMF